MEPSWVLRWKYWTAPRPTKPGVWRMKGGGHYIRGRATNPRTQRQQEVSAPLANADASQAYEHLQEELRRIREGGAQQTRTTFADFALSLLARKIRSGEIRSAKTREQWGYTLEHHLVPAFGKVQIGALRRMMIEDWKNEVAALIQRKEYSPVTANNWIKLLRVIVNTAVAELELERNPVLGVKDFDTSTHQTYTDEEPNALELDEVPQFLGEMRRRYPQHFAFTALGFALGLRPSTLRPLRRTGITPDLIWDRGVLLVRRSQTVGQEVMEKTKTGKRQRLTLPEDLMDILRWHQDQLPVGPMQASELLFPSDLGGYRSRSSLDKPFREVATAIGLKKRITPRAMRRTYQDLCRAAEVKDIVTRAISGHATETMQQHYSTVSGDEMRESIAKVISLAGVRDAFAGKVVGKVVGEEGMKKAG